MGVLSRWSCFLVKDPGTIVPTRARNGRLMEKQPRQRIHYLRTRDGVQLAWADASAGPLLVKAATWLTHLEYEWESPVWGHWLRFFCDHFRLVRYDERGCGMSDWNVGDLLTLLTEGLGNADIAERLSLSEKTVRNHLSNLFDKLGVWTRAQAIVFARDRGFGVP